MSTTGDAVAAKLGDDVPGGVTGLRVHAGRRLVQEDELGPADQRHGQGQPLPLPAGEPPDLGAGGRAQADPVQELAGIVRVSRVAGEEREQLQRPGRGVAAHAVLEHHARREGGGRTRSDPGRGRGRCPHRRYGSLRRSRWWWSCAGPVRPEHRDQLAGDTAKLSPSTTARPS